MALLAAAAAMAWAQTNGSLLPDSYTSGNGKKVKILIGPFALKGGVVQLEHHKNSSTARLRVVTHSIWTDYRDLDMMLTVFRQTLARKKPFLVIWDIRSLTWPRVKGEQVRQVKKFADGFARQWDTYAQANVIILSNPIIRTFAGLLLRFFSTPQPYHIARDDAGADDFAQSCCNKPRSFVKASYDTDSEFKLFGSGSDS